MRLARELKGLAQACFDSYDPDLFLNPSCDPLSLSNIIPSNQGAGK